ncbi:MAG: hypothetical protein IPO27_16445 [Bacteroidetes bacterium]|nr:hypothetical protein [Bacteroidota bacterium]
MENDQMGVNTNGARINESEMGNVINTFITQVIEQEDNTEDFEYQDATIIMEGCLNYLLCKPDTIGKETAMDTTYFLFDVAMQNGEYMISADDMNTLYSEVHVSVASAVNRVGFPANDAKWREWCDIEIIRAELNLGTNEDEGEIEIRVVSKVTNVSFIPDCYVHCGYGVNDWWSCFNFFISCGTNSCPQTSYWECARVVGARLNAHNKICNVQNVNGYYFNIQSVYVPNTFLNPNDPVPGDNINDWMMFAGLTNLYTCYAPIEMDMYHSNLKWVANNYSGKPAGKAPFSYDYKIVNPLNGTYNSHAYIEYGKFNKYIAN